MAKQDPGKLLCLVALVSGLTDLGCGLYCMLESLFGGGMLAGLGILVGAASIGLGMLAAVAIHQSARGRHIVAWLAVTPAAIAAAALLGVV